jgi:hypothetical protein
MGEDSVDGVQQGRAPFHGPSIRSVVSADAEAGVILPQVARDGMGEPQLAELVEDEPDDGPNLVVRAERQAISGRLDVPDRRVEDPFAPAGLLSLPRPWRLRMI